MRAVWHVVWSDLNALTWFAAAALLAALLASTLGVYLGSRRRNGSRRSLATLSIAGASLGIVAALAVAMILDLALEMERLGSRQHLRQHIGFGLGAVASTVALLAGWVLARDSATAGPVGNQPRWRKFTLRQLFAGQLAIALLFGWWAFTRQAELRERSTFEAIEAQRQIDEHHFRAFGWTVTAYHDGIILAPVDWHPRDSVDEQPADDRALERVVAHGRVRGLLMVSSSVTDLGLETLSRCDSLRDLTIRSNQITDDGLAHLSRAPRLQYVSIRSKQVTGAGLQNLVELQSLNWRVLEGTQANEQDVAEFKRVRPDVRVDLHPDR